MKRFFKESIEMERGLSLRGPLRRTDSLDRSKSCDIWRDDGVCGVTWLCTSASQNPTGSLVTIKLQWYPRGGVTNAILH